MGLADKLNSTGYGNLGVISYMVRRQHKDLASKKKSSMDKMIKEDAITHEIPVDVLAKLNLVYGDVVLFKKDDLYDVR